MLKQLLSARVTRSSVELENSVFSIDGVSRLVRVFSLKRQTNKNNQYGGNHTWLQERKEVHSLWPLANTLESSSKKTKRRQPTLAFPRLREGRWRCYLNLSRKLDIWKVEGTDLLCVWLLPICGSKLSPHICSFGAAACSVWLHVLYRREKSEAWVSNLLKIAHA